MVKRSREEIIREILEVCIPSASKTMIIHSCRVSFNGTVLYINYLIKHGFLKIAESKPVAFETTQKGLQLLLQLQKIQDIISYQALDACQDQNF